VVETGGEEEGWRGEGFGGVLGFDFASAGEDGEDVDLPTDRPSVKGLSRTGGSITRGTGDEILVKGLAD